MTFVDQLFSIYIVPEVDRRRAAGQLPEPFLLRAAQVVFFADERATVVRLNGEVRAVAKVKLRAGVVAVAGEPARTDQIEDWLQVALPETEDPNCGHATMLRIGDQWLVEFDCRYNRGKSEILVSRAREFLILAEDALARKHLAPFAYTLFSAAELAAKAELLGMPSPDLEQSRKHAAIHAALNKSAHLGNIDGEHASAFNRLSQVRPTTYSAAAFALGADEASRLLEAVRGLVEYVEERLGIPAEVVEHDAVAVWWRRRARSSGRR